MKKGIRLLWGMWFVLLVPGLSLAQLTVQGKITDTRGEALPGANILVPGTTMGTASDDQGGYQFVIANPGAETVIEVRYLGYKTGRQTVSQRSGEVTLNFSLSEDILMMDQVVVTGNSISAEKGTLGNSIATVNAKQFDNSGAVQIDAALSGKVPGALVQQNSGTPGGGTSVRIRGTSTINRSAEPLYIVDGVIIDNSSSQLVNLGGYTSNRVADLDPNDIERIEIVKGAAAAALYGSRANDGVVQIFTKRGRPGRLKLTYRNSLSIEDVEKRLEVNSYPFNAAGQPVTRHNYQDQIFRTGITYNSTLSISGGDDKTRYYLSGSYLNQDGVVEATSYRKENVRLNLDRFVTDWLNVSTTMSYIHSKAELVPNAGLTGLFGVLTNFLFTPNDYNLFRDPVTGQFPRGFLFANPLETIANWQAPQDIDRFIGGARLTAVPITGLTVEYRFGFDGYTQSAQQFVPRNSSAPSLALGLALSAVQKAQLLNSDMDVNYVFNLAGGIRSTTGVGMNYQQQNFDILSARAEDLTLLTQTLQGSQQFSNELIDNRRTLGFYVQETLNFSDRVYLTGALRSDASSAFGKDDRQQYFPKASASIDVSNFAFWQRSLAHTINRLRLRSAFGYSGGQPAGSYERFSNYVFEPNAGRSGIVNSPTQGNESLKPERMREVEVGADMELFSGHLGIEFTYYDQETKDLILPKTVTPSTGFASQLANVGVLTNKGIELLIRTFNFRRPSFTWSTTASISTNDPLVKKLSDGGAFFIPESFNVIRVDENEPPGHFYGTTYVRDASGNIMTNADGIPIIGPRKIIGDPNPDVIWSLTNEVSFGDNLSLRVQFDAVTGQDVFNFDRRLLETPAFGAGKEYERELRGELPRGYFQARRSIFEEYIEDGSWIKLREVSAQYNLGAAFAGRFGLRDIQLTATGRNLFTLTDYTGWDPEANAGGQRTLVRGYGFATIPIPRSIVFGLTLNY